MLIRNAQVWGSGQADVRLSGERIADIGALPSQSGETVIDAGGQLQRPGSGWIRGIGYHESVMGLPDARQLDLLVPDRPFRIQHRSGRLWLLNSPALAELLATAEAPPGLNREKGHLFDEDRWLQAALASTPPDFSRISADLARCGVTGITDMTPHNDAANAAHCSRQVAA
ncbi:MAG: hydrolase, partial [Sphingomonadales bacterium]|nr:hydrolase [Sphingomonadales bacterium]